MRYGVNSSIRISFLFSKVTGELASLFGSPVISIYNNGALQTSGSMSLSVDSYYFDYAPTTNGSYAAVVTARYDTGETVSTAASFLVGDPDSVYAYAYFVGQDGQGITVTNPLCKLSDNSGTLLAYSAMSNVSGSLWGLPASGIRVGLDSSILITFKAGYDGTTIYGAYNVGGSGGDSYQSVSRGIIEISNQVPTIEISRASVNARIANKFSAVEIINTPSNMTIEDQKNIINIL